jgi:hypothetical protein
MWADFAENPGKSAFELDFLLSRTSCQAPGNRPLVKWYVHAWTIEQKSADFIIF